MLRGKAGWLLWFGLVVAPTSCRRADSESAQTNAIALTAVDPATIVSTLKARPGSPLGASLATGFDPVATGGLKPRFAAADVSAEAKPARVTLPALATGALHVEDAATGMAADVTLAGALAVAAQTTDGYVVYPAAHASGATLLHRPTASGSEDFLALDTKPAKAEIVYNVTFTGVAGLRAVGGSVEMLDAGGAPRLRVAPPFIVGSDGAATDATLAVSGCAVDTNPAPPWGRTVTALGSGTCQFKLTWSGSGVSYPVVIDPRWQTTGSLATARVDHTMTLLAATGKVLVAGGRSTSSGTTGLASAEIYDQASGTFAATASMTGGRYLHAAVQLNLGSNSTTSQKVLIAGGTTGGSSLSTALLYNATAGTWASAGNGNWSVLSTSTW